MKPNTPKYPDLKTAFSASLLGGNERIAQWHFYLGAACMFDLIACGDEQTYSAVLRELRQFMNQAQKRIAIAKSGN